MEALDTRTQKWTNMQDIPSMCRASAACSLNGFIYVSGGFDVELRIESNNRMCVFNCTTCQWVTSSTNHDCKPQHKRSHHTLTECNGLLVAIGGMHSYKSLSNTEYLALAPVTVHSLNPKDCNKTQNSLSKNDSEFSDKSNTLDPHPVDLGLNLAQITKRNLVEAKVSQGSVPAAVGSPAPSAVSTRSPQPANRLTDRLAAAYKPVVAAASGTSSVSASSASDTDAPASALAPAPSTSLKDKLAAAKMANATHWTNGAVAAVVVSPAPVSGSLSTHYVIRLF